MQRIQEHRLALGKVINDDRIGGDNRFLAELVAMWMDCKIPTRGGQPKTPEAIEAAKREADLIESIILSRFVSKNGSILKIDKGADEGPVAKIETEATAIERAAIDSLLGRG